jgi:hypothetical protein
LTAVGKVEEKLVDAIKDVDYKMAGNLPISDMKTTGTVLLVTEARDATGKALPRLKGKYIRLLGADESTVQGLLGENATVQGVLKTHGAIEVLSIVAYPGASAVPRKDQTGPPTEPLKSKATQRTAKFVGTIDDLQWQAGLPISASTWKETVIRLKEYPDHAFYMSSSLSKKHGFEPPGVGANIQAAKLTGTKVRLTGTAIPAEAGESSDETKYRVATYEVIK